MQVDVTRKRAPATIERAIREYGDTLTDPTYDAFAYLVAQGSTAKAAYQTCFPDADDSTARSQSSILLAHPSMAEILRDQLIGARNLLQASASRMSRRLLEEAHTATKDTKPRIDAINSALDRAGVPRMKEVAVSMSVDLASASAAFDGVIEGEAIGPDQIEATAGSPLELPAVEAELIEDHETDARSAWAALVPIDELRSVDLAGTEASDDDE